MSSNRAKHNIVAVSAFTRETGINVFADPDLSVNCAIGNTGGLERRFENDEDEATGYEEVTQVYYLGQTAKASLEFARAQPHHLAVFLAYALGTVAAPEAAGDGYLHVITPIDGDLEDARSNPTFTLADRLGKTIKKRRFASMAVNSATVVFSADAFVKLNCDLIGTGKAENHGLSEIVTAPGDSAQLTLTANGIHGADAATRLKNVHRIRVWYDGAWRHVRATAVSAATPAVIDITNTTSAPVGDLDWEILYVPVEAAPWMTFPANIQESPLRTSGAALYIGGEWDGTDFGGGVEYKAGIKSVEWSHQNNMTANFGFGAEGDFASEIDRANRKQTLKLDKKLADYVFEQMATKEEQFGFKITVSKTKSGFTYITDFVWPKVQVSQQSENVDGHRDAESVEFTVLESKTYPTCIVRVTNLESRQYAG